jgi:hypothetical protein
MKKQALYSSTGKLATANSPDVGTGMPECKTLSEI